jgi:hypothetical protein
MQCYTEGGIEKEEHKSTHCMQCVNKQEGRMRREQERTKKPKTSIHCFFLPQIDLALDRPATLGSFESFSLPD